MTLLQLPRRTNRLPGTPSIQQLKHQAKDVLKAHKSGDEACAEVLSALEKFSDKPARHILETTLTLQEVQHALARSYQFSSWTDLTETVAAMNGQVDANQTDPVAEFVNLMLIGGLKDGASQILFEPYEFNYRVRYRVDGVLHTVASPPIELAERIATLIKDKAALPVNPVQLPVTGQFPFKLSKTKTIEFKVDAQPTAFGDRLVLRVLDASAVSVGFAALGLDQDQIGSILGSLQDGRGLILFVGPKESGRTVTMLTAVNQMNQPGNELCSVEQPVEVLLEGVNQTSIVPGDDKGVLDAVLANVAINPDVLALSEIKTPDLATTVLQAAATGQFMLATAFAENVTDALIRVNHWSAGSTALISAVNLVVAQKLIRRLCNACKVQRQPTEAELLKLGSSPGEITLFDAVGCEDCHDGYRGRVGVFEVLKVSAAMANAIAGGMASPEIDEMLAEAQLLRLQDVARQKVREGITSLAEAERVVG
jgi:type IV pilus assembly protein PilB